MRERERESGANAARVQIHSTLGLSCGFACGIRGDRRDAAAAHERSSSSIAIAQLDYHFHLPRAISAQRARVCRGPPNWIAPLPPRSRGRSCNCTSSSRGSRRVQQRTLRFRVRVRVRVRVHATARDCDGLLYSYIRVQFDMISAQCRCRKHSSVKEATHRRTNHCCCCLLRRHIASM